jgi:type I restriction enzyme S subunit
MNVARIEDVSEFVLDGTHASPVRTETGVPVLSAQNVKDGVLDFKTDRYTSEEEYRSFKSRLALQEGDLLLTIVGTIGRSAVVSAVRPLVFQRSVAIIRPRAGVLDPRFFFHASRTQGFQAQLASSTNQSSQAGVYLGKLKEVKIPLPPLAEQRRIAELLDRPETLRAKRRAALAQLDTPSQSIFLDLFGNPITNPKLWSTVSIGDVAGIIVPTRDKPKRFVGDIPWVTLPDLRGLFVSKSQYALTIQDANEVGNRLIPAHSVLLSCAGTLGRVAVTSTPVYANQQFYGLVPQTDKIDVAFLAFCLSLKGEAFFARLGGSFTIGFFSKQKALDIKLPLPPLSTQREFSRRITAVEKLKSVHCASLATLDTMFFCLQHRAFRGEL